VWQRRPRPAAKRMDRRGKNRGGREGEETPDRWDRPGSGRKEGERPWATARVREGLARAGPGRCGPGRKERREARAEGSLGRGAAHAGRGGEGRPEREKGRGVLGCWALLPLLLLFFSFTQSIQTNYLNSNRFEFKPYKLNTRKKIMLQHECTNMLTLKLVLFSCVIKCFKCKVN
jgi:hypothetical protein